MGEDVRMKELLLFVARSLVDQPDEVQVEETEGPEAIILELRAPDDMGKVIGRQGRIAKAIRSVVKAATEKAQAGFCGDSMTKDLDMTPGHPEPSGYLVIGRVLRPQGLRGK